MPRTNKHNKKKANKAANQMTTSEERFEHYYPNMINFLSDNRNGADPAKNNAIREHMQKPEVARAFYEFLMSRDLSRFDPTAPCPLSPAHTALLREHFPDQEI